ncbi:MAG: MopE-related protein [Myxococcota bacterium]
MNFSPWITISFLALTTGCGSKLVCGPGTEESGGECVGTHVDQTDPDIDEDGDGDGFISANDCDDTEAAAYPGADERCDGIDNDCDGQTDESDAIDQSTFFSDLDGDGYGNADSPITACEAPSNTVEDDTDCDDTDISVNPGATEVWYDGVDSDCAGDVDDDRDGDGFPGGPDGTDCDDEEPLAYPMAEEICGDGIDNNCDGSLGECGLSGEIMAIEAHARLLGAGDDTYAGASVAFLGDINDDTFSDMLIGSPRLDTTLGANVGGVTIVSGSISGITELAELPGIYGVQAGWLAGSGVVAPGDLNLDGTEDLLIIVPGDDGVEPESLDTGDPLAVTHAGAVHFFSGPITRDTLLDTSIHMFRGEITNHGIGAVSVIGDQGGDGRSEVTFGLSNDDRRGDGAGAVIMINSPWSGDTGPDEGLRLGGSGPGEAAGSALASPGDLNGDGLDDLIIGAPMAESAPPGSPYEAADSVRVDAGAVYVVYGPILRDLFLDDADAIHVGEHDSDHAGSTLAAPGDVNGDGLDDLMVGAPGWDREYPDTGTAYIVYGPAARGGTLGGAHVKLRGVEGYGRAGFSISGAGDTDGDGHREVLVGADQAGSGAGVVYLIHGHIPGTHDVDEGIAQFVGASVGDSFGTSIAGGMDMNGDGLDDILIGAPGEDTAGDNAGAAYLYLGEPR